MNFDVEKAGKSAARRIFDDLETLRAENARLREAMVATAALLGDTPRDRLKRLDIVANETREAVRLLAVRYNITSGDYMDQCAKILRAAIATTGAS